MRDVHDAAAGGAPEGLTQLGNLLVVGGGRMGAAIVAGLVGPGGVDPDRVTVANPGREKRERLTRRYGVACVADASQAPNPDTCIVAVKPQVLPDVLEGLAGPEGTGACDGPFAPKLVISIAAGISTRTLAGMLPGSQIVRAMPNTPLTVGRGVVGISLGQGTSQEAGQLVVRLFSCMGTAVVVDEPLQDAIVALSGSGPAYFALFVQALAQAGASLGLPDDLAAQLSLQTMAGTAELLQRTGMTPSQLIDAVSSPGGTTVAALDAMRAQGVEQAIAAGAQACAQRSRELGS